MVGSAVSVLPGAGRRGVGFQAFHGDGGVHVIPADAVPLLRAGKLDLGLFDVGALVKQPSQSEVRMIVTYKDGPADVAIAGVAEARRLPAIDGAAVTVAAEDAQEFWNTLSGPSELANGVEKIWLDGVLEPVLEQSVPQIGAPDAWRAGLTGTGVKVAVLDTGIDATHPDLAPRIVAAQNFTDEDPADVVGHGTHVASTIAGTAAASDGQYKGVAPDVQLLDGKVCQVDACFTSATIAGMQWATEQDARVVNLSIGGPDTPSVDPLKRAINTLTEQTGTLFVVAAGNTGPSRQTVESPGSAEAALTVGAVDKQDALADFSSRGPRLGDDGLKPDLTAPGVDIVAARSKDGQIGTPVGDAYVSLSGTSMATPHAAGAAAILAQQHPDWTGPRLKAALMGSADPAGELTAYDQGAGRLNVAAAIEQTVTAQPASLSFGMQRWPHEDDQPVSRTLTYQNHAAEPVTLGLASALIGPDGKPAPAGPVTLSANEITVPPGGSADVTVTMTTRHAGPDGHFTGAITATSGEMAVRTTVAVHKEVESYDVTIRNVDRFGNPAHGAVNGFGDPAKGDLEPGFPFFGAETQVRLAKGTYVFDSHIQGFSEDSPNSVMVWPHAVIDKDQTMTFDAREAKPISVRVDKPSAETYMVEAGWVIKYPSGWIKGRLMWSDRTDNMFTAHLGPAVPNPIVFDGLITTQFAEPGPDREFNDSPYRYLLTFYQPRRMFDGLDETVHDKELATVTSSMAKHVEGRRGYKGTWGQGQIPTFLNLFAPGFALPSSVTEYYLARGARYASWGGEGVPIEGGRLNPVTDLISDRISYRPGAQTRDRWNTAVFGPAFPPHDWPFVDRAGDRIIVSLEPFSDGTGHAGNSTSDSESTRLYRNGELVGESGDFPGSLEVIVPPGDAAFELTTTVDRSTEYPLSTKLEATWQFRSAHTDRGTPLPLWGVQLEPSVDEHNYVKRQRVVLVPVKVHAQRGADVGELRDLSVEASFDDGETWKKVQLLPHGELGRLAVLEPGDADFVSFRVKALDTKGNALKETIIRGMRFR